MEFIVIIGFITALVIPLALLIIGIFNFTKKVKISEILIKLAIAFFLYLLVTLTLLAIAFSNIFSLVNNAAHVNDPEPFKTYHLVIASLIVIAYAAFGLFLCWFMKRDLMKSLWFITGKNEKPQSVFGGD